MRTSGINASVLRVLATYGVACFVILQLLDVVREPLSIPAAVTRAVLLVMFALAPVVVFVTAIRSRRIADRAAAGGVSADDLVFAIGAAELDTARREIRFGGRPVEVQPKVFDLITYLIRHRDRVVSKDELFDEIWPSVVVSEASLTQSIKRARDLFRSNGFDGEVIRTVPRKGYQFDHEVTAAAESGPSASNAWTGVLLPTGAVAVAAAVLAATVWTAGGDREAATPGGSANAIVVLPFRNLSADQDFDYFSDGLTETLTNSLATVRGLRVIARGSAFSLKGQAIDYAGVGQDLNVAHAVEGTVQRDGDRLRITAKLIRTTDAFQAWSRIYSREFTDIFLVQDDISRSIVENMADVLSASLSLPAQTAGGAGGPNDAEAYRLLLRAHDQRRDQSSAGLRAAEASYREALRLRPDYAEAMLGLARAIRLQAVTGGLPREESFAESLDLIHQALTIRPDYADAHLELAEIQHRHLWDFAGAERSYLLASELGPGSASVHAAYSRFLSKTGHVAEAVEQARIALDLDPRSSGAGTALAIRLIKTRELGEAQQLIDGLSVRHPDLADLPWLYANWHVRNGSHQDALAAIAREELAYLRLSLSAIILHALGREGQSLAALEQLIETDADGAAFQIAEAYAQRGDADSAFAWLERAYSHGDPGLAELYSSLNLESLYGDTRFATLAERVGLPPPPAVSR